MYRNSFITVWVILLKHNEKTNRQKRVKIDLPHSMINASIRYMKAWTRIVYDQYYSPLSRNKISNMMSYHPDPDLDQHQHKIDLSLAI